MSGSSGAYNYAEALQKALFFYECQRSGPLPSNNRVSWRGDSGLTDGQDNDVDLTGGWYDAGDHVKFGFPMAGSATMLAWGAVEYAAGYQRAGQWPFLLDNLRWVCDYFVKCHTAPDELWGQVGLGKPDHSWWGSGEVMPMARPSFKIDVDHPGSDLAAETAAALAASSLVFRTEDADYAAVLLQHARELYSFADRCRGKYSDSIPDAHNFYRSADYLDELVWGAAWLFRATREASYLNLVATAYHELPLQAGTPHRRYKGGHNWHDKSFGAAAMLAILTDDTVYRDDAERWLDWLTVGVDGDCVHYTPGGLAWIGKWGSLRMVANAAFIALVYADCLPEGPQRDRYHAFGVRQMDYALGDNPLRRSFLVGFGQNPPRNPHHRTAHGAWTNDPAFPAESRHILYGAVVGGPDRDDYYMDDRGDYVLNEVACDYNAGFTSALARLALEFGGEPLADFPQPEHPSREFRVVAAIESHAPGELDLRIVVTNASAWPARVTRNLTVRYFLAGAVSANDFTVEAPGARWAGSVGRAAAEEAGAYVLVDLSGDSVFPSDTGGGSREIRLHIAGPENWDPEADWKLPGLAPADRGHAPNVALYSGGSLVAGAEPAQ